MSGLNPCSAAGLEEFCQALVFEASNHSLIVPCNVSGVKAHNAEAHRWLCRSAAETKASEWRAWLNYYRSPSRPCHTRRMMMALGWSEYRTTYFPKTISRTESGTGAISTGVPILGKSGSNS